MTKRSTLIELAETMMTFALIVLPMESMELLIVDMLEIPFLNLKLPVFKEKRMVQVPLQRCKGARFGG